ncbi:unnamed protein product [Brassicogethes aeneus]|nr:unnamed protein product [Brassicogethes aeneus]
MAYQFMKNIKPEKLNLDTNQAGFSELFVKSKDKHGVILLEDVVKMDLLDQYAENVIEYTSRFNCANSLSYAPANITGKYVVYPSYGDFPDAYFLRSYGKWWVERAAYQKEYMLQDLDPLSAEDYITIQ